MNGLGFRVAWEAITLDSPMDGQGRNARVLLYVDDADAHYREWRARVGVSWV
ncbi:MAG: hypothetical protein ABI972_19380 [Acidobacteriota bacterium]